MALPHRFDEIGFIGLLVAQRKQKQISQGEMAKALGISQASLSRLETMKSQPSLRQVLTMAEKVGIEFRMFECKE